MLFAYNKKDNAESLKNLGNLYRKEGRYEEAEKYYLKAIEKGNIEA